MELLIKGGTIITMNERRQIIRDGYILIKDDKIEEVGKLGKSPVSAEETIDATGKFIMPGMINTHTHLWQSIGKGLGTDRDLWGWISSAWSPLLYNLTDDDYYNAVMLGVLEAIKSGVTTVLGYEHALNTHPTAITKIVDAFKLTGIRALLGIGYQDTGKEMGAPDFVLRPTNVILKYLEDSFKKYHNTLDGRLKIWLAPGLVSWCTEELLLESKRLAEKYNTGLTIHANESKTETEYSRRERGASEIGFLYKLGVLDKNTLVVHAVWTTDEEIEMLAERNAKVSHNPVSNMFLSSGVAPIPKMLKKGIAVGLATDGATSNNNNDFFDVLRVTPLLQKVHTLDPLSLTAEQTLEMATIIGAKAVLMENEIGSLEVGKKADIVILNFKHHSTTPNVYPPATIVYSASSENVETVIIDGRIIMENRKIQTFDENKVLENADKSIEQIISKAQNILEERWPIM
ncbi:MAG: amidohydrolase [Candidatus Odinarchaeota archaeon]|nr:amidohydrolase [Candidatus Odinarchaeota archaeon]